MAKVSPRRRSTKEGAEGRENTLIKIAVSKLYFKGSPAFVLYSMTRISDEHNSNYMYSYIVIY